MNNEEQKTKGETMNNEEQKTKGESMTKSFIVLIKNEDKWRFFAQTDSFFHAMWICDRMLETGLISRDRVDIIKGNGAVKK